VADFPKVTADVTEAERHRGSSAETLYLACDEALDWEPDDPRLIELAAAVATWDVRGLKHKPDQPETLTLMYSHATSASPAWQRLMKLLVPRPERPVYAGNWSGEDPCPRRLALRGVGARGAKLGAGQRDGPSVRLDRPTDKNPKRDPPAGFVVDMVVRALDPVGHGRGARLSTRGADR